MTKLYELVQNVPRSRRQFKGIIMSGDENQLTATKISEPSYIGKNSGHYSYFGFG